MTTSQTIDGVPREQMISFPRELDDEMAEILAEKARVCGAGAFDIWELLCARFGTETAVRPQGDPVAYADPKAFENFGSLAHLGGLYAREWMWANPAPGLVPLYAEQPAPVAVVLPERREPTQDNPYLSDADHDWNACVDEVTRLNAKSR